MPLTSVRPGSFISLAWDDWAALSTPARVGFRRQFGLTWQRPQRSALPGSGSRPEEAYAIQLASPEGRDLAFSRPTHILVLQAGEAISFVR